MMIVNMLEAKTNLSKLVESLENHAEEQIVIARNGRPVARLVACQPGAVTRLIGVAKGRFSFDKAAFDAADEEVANLFQVPPLEELSP